MDQKLFEEKLTEVAEWRRQAISNEDLSCKNITPCCENPTEIILDKIKPQPCPYIQGNQGCYIITKWYPYVQNRTVKVQRCTTCRAVITPKGQVLPNQSLTNIASKVWWTDNPE